MDKPSCIEKFRGGMHIDCYLSKIILTAFLQAVQIGSEAISHICKEVEAWAGTAGRSKRTDRVPAENTLESPLSSFTFSQDIKAVYKQTLGTAKAQHKSLKPPLSCNTKFAC